MPPHANQLTRSRSIFLAFACLLLASLVSASQAQARLSRNAKAVCVYSAHSIATLQQFEQMTGDTINCVHVYIASPNWQGWEWPWFINYYKPDNNWSQWATQPGTKRQLIITNSLVPTQVAAQSNWLQQGAAGAYTSYARTFAQSLVNAGLGGSIIRLSPESNGTWNADSLGKTPAQWALWDELWRQTVTAMRSVPGANFQFDFNIAALYRPLPLAQIYPGDGYVDFIGADVYDSGNIGNTAAARWNDLYNGPDGISTVVAFAKLHNKPFSIPEWGVGTPGVWGFGDNPLYVNGIAQVVKNTVTAYQSYFYRYGQAIELQTGPQSLAAYKAAFGPLGTSVGSEAGATAPAPSPYGVTQTSSVTASVTYKHRKATTHKASKRLRHAAKRAPRRTRRRGPR
jgi:hypothetical protein